MDIEAILSQMTLEEKASLCSGRDFWHTKGIERLGIPEVLMCDGPHGLRKQLGEGDHLGINESIETVCYPSASALASSFDRSAARRLGEALGQECQAEHVGMLLGPGINIKRNPLCGRNFEYFSEDPYAAGEMAVAYVNALQEKGVSACAKHFAANNQETMRQSGSSNMDERTLHEIYLPAFEAVVKESHVGSIMCAYNAVNGTFCSENKTLLTDILRDRWGFTGFVVTDWGAVKDRVKGLLAGLDLEMPGGLGVQDADIVAAARSGKLDEEVLDEAVRHVLRFVSFYQEHADSDAQIDREACAALAQQLSEECAVLLKNEHALPLKKNAQVAFIGPFAREPRYQGSGSSHIHVRHAVGAMEAAQGQPVCFAEGYRLDSDESDQALLDDAVSLAARCEAAVIFAGLPNSYESEGFDRTTLAMPENQNALILEVAKANPNTIVVLHGGAPMELPWIDCAKAVLCVHLGGQQVGAATVRLLYGEANPSGHLAETWPLRLEDVPSYLDFPGHEGVTTYHETIHVGYRYYDKKKMPVLFPFGHGLSYTTFECTALKAERETMMDTESLLIRCRVKNTGDRAGKAVVQLYIRPVKPSAIRPVRELKRFDAVPLAPGEEKELCFTLDGRAFAYYETKIHDWFVESGDYIVEAGFSSRDIRQCCTVSVTGTKEIPVTYTEHSPMGDLMKSEKGRAFLQNMMAQRRQARQGASDHEKNMGEGSDKAVEKMMFEMPLSSMVTFGRMTRQQLNDMLAALNG